MCEFYNIFTTKLGRYISVDQFRYNRHDKIGIMTKSKQLPGRAAGTVQTRDCVLGRRGDRRIMRGF